MKKMVFKFGFGGVVVESNPHSGIIRLTQIKQVFGRIGSMKKEDLDDKEELFSASFNSEIYKDSLIELKKELQTVKSGEIIEFENILLDFNMFNKKSVETLLEAINRALRPSEEKEKLLFKFGFGGVVVQSNAFSGTIILTQINPPFGLMESLHESDLDDKEELFSASFNNKEHKKSLKKLKKELRSVKAGEIIEFEHILLDFNTFNKESIESLINQINGVLRPSKRLSFIFQSYEKYILKSLEDMK